ncbi:MAG: hypothetical protein QM733_05680 [Ilumatobacteraceae bacterium]
MSDSEVPSDEVTDAVAAPPERHRGRSTASAVLGVLTVLLLVVSTVAVWASATVLRRERAAAIVGDALAEPEVQAALADRITTEVANAIDLPSLVTQLLPSDLGRFGSMIAAGAQEAVERALTNLLGQEQVQQLLVTIVEKAHDAAMHLLEGGGFVDGVTVQNGVVTLNLLPLVDDALALVQKTGLLGSITLPTLDAAGDPQQQIAALEQALGRDLPDDFGQIVVYQSEALANAQANLQMAQDMLVAAKRYLVLALVLLVVCAVATILLAVQRWRAALLVGVGAAGAMVLLRAAVRMVVATAPDLVAKPAAKTAVRVILDSATGSLMRVAGVLLLVGLVVVAIGMMRRREWRADLILVVAVAAGVAVPAAAGLSIWSLLAGLVVGIVLPFVARWLLSHAPHTPEGGPTPPAAAPADVPATSAVPDAAPRAPASA